MTWILTVLAASGLNKLWPYLAVAGIVALIILTSYQQGRSTGTASAKQKQLNDWLNTQYKETTDRAKIESMSTNDARAKLRKRWSQR